MLLNGAIDRDLYSIDFKVEYLGKTDNTIDLLNCAAWSITNKGNVPFLVDNSMEFDAGNCASRSFPNFLGLDYTGEKELKWKDTGIVEPNYKIELIRIYIVKKPIK